VSPIPESASSMLPVYVFAAILGGGLLLLGMLGGDGDLGDGMDVDSGVGSKPGGWTHVFSFQTGAYAMAAFGLTGAALTLLGAASLPTLGLAAGMGVVAGTLVGLVFDWLRRNQSGFAETSDHYIGGIGRAEVRIPSGGRGRIELVHRGRSFTLPATSTRGEIDRHETVVVIDVVDGIALVDRAPRELTL
jgi:membrane protein implicated in regulation of membrane protease activity